MASLDKFKINAVVWDSDKEPSKFTTWLDTMSSIVRSMEHGPALESFLDHKLERRRHQCATIPSFLASDPDFDMDDDTDAERGANTHARQCDEDEEPHDSDPSGSGSVSAFQMHSAGTPYKGLSKESRTLDSMLYNVLRVNVKGSKNALLSCVKFPSYVQAICVLYKHMDISRNDRKLRALEAADRLTYKGDVQVYMVDAVRIIRELKDSKCSMTDYMLTRIIKSFEGKSKTTQYKIAEFINSHQVDENTNLFDLVQQVCADIASVGDSKAHANFVDIVCHFCKKHGHVEADCFKKNKGKGGKGSGKGNRKSAGKADKFEGDCNHCGVKGHREKDCRKKAAGTLAVPKAAAAVNASAGLAGVNAVSNNTQQSSDVNALAALVEHLKKGGKVNLINVVRVDTGTPKVTRTEKSSIALSLCDGMGCMAMGLRAIDAQIDRYISVENHSGARVIGVNANPETSTFPGVDHSWKSDVTNITEQDIIDLGVNNIKILGFGAPCEDMSKLRLLPDRPGYPQRRCRGDPRPGLSGPKGQVFRAAIKVASWVRKHNPDCELFVENVDFSDMPEDWAEVCKALGKPIIINAADHSYTKRNRAYWTTFDLPDDPAAMTAGYGPLRDPDACMDPGRKVQTYLAHGQAQVRPIGKSWRGDPDHPEADTNLPVLVDDEMHEKPQHLRPQEAERLMGMAAGCTAGSGATAKERLRAIGNAWDMNVVRMLFRFSRLSRLPPEVAAQRQQSTYSMAVIDGMSPITDLTDEMRITQALLVSMQDTSTPSEFATMLAAHTTEHRNLYLSLLQHWYAHGAQCLASYAGGSVLDSGSSKHIDPRTCVTDTDERISLTGFDNSTQWTEGNGYLPLEIIDQYTGETVKIDVNDVERLSNVVSPILSMGKLIRRGFDFHFTDNGEQMLMLTPNKAHKVIVELGPDDIIRLPNNLRTGRDSNPLPQINQCSLLRRTADDANYGFLHDVLNHCGAEKQFQTLGVTKGYTQVRLPPSHCDTCAQTKAREFGLSRKKHLAQLIQEAPCPDGGVLMQEALRLLPGALVFNVAQSNADGSAAELCGNVHDDVNHDDGLDEEVQYTEVEYAAPTAGRQLGIQSVPRFDLEAIRPFELMFVDNKDYPCEVRGGAMTAFIFVDYKSRAKFKFDVITKRNNGAAFSRVVAMNGVHKLPYKCRVMTDGCGSMVHVAEAAARMGIDHAYVPPHQQSLNEAEKVADQMWAAARALLLHSNAPESMFSKAVDYAMYVDLRTATTASRGWKTPYEMIRGSVPSISRLHRFYTKVFVTVPKAKRKVLQEQGLHVRAEQGRFVGFHDPFSSTYAAVLSMNRLVHSINVVFNDSDYRVGSVAHESQSADPAFDMAVGVRHEEAIHIPDDDVIDLDSLVDDTRLHSLPMGGYGQEGSPPWKTHSSPPKPRPRPAYAFLAQAEQAFRQGSDAILNDAVSALAAQADHDALISVCYVLSTHAVKDLVWKQALEGTDKAAVIAALEAEIAALESTILTKITEDHPEYAEAVRNATTGRFILDRKRQGKYKARGVKQGFKEDKATADGPDFVYYANVAKLASVRTALFRPNRGTRRCAIKDVSTAFLQSNKYPEGLVKYICFKHPITGLWVYYRQSGPIYGEASAPVRWEDTIAPWFADQAFERGENEPCVFLQPDRDLLCLLYVDDTFADGEQEDIEWISELMDERFECKELEWLVPLKPMDYLGMDIQHDENYTYLSMYRYIRSALTALGFDGLAVKDTPMTKSIDSTSPALSSASRRQFMTACGCLGWLVNTVRIDCSYAYSRITQHMASPNESAQEALIRVFAYLKGTPELCLAAPIHAEDLDLSSQLIHENEEDSSHFWKFWCDSDFAGNAEVQNARKSQNGYVSTLSDAPVKWHSKVSSVAYAHPDIGEAHADFSSSSAEIYCAANATQEMLYQSYVADEMGIPFPKPATLMMDNSAAEAFTNKSVNRSKLKHIDVRQEWVQMLRNKNLIKPRHVPSKDNVADLMTKILPTHDFIRLRDKVMKRLPERLVQMFKPIN